MIYPLITKPDLDEICFRKNVLDGMHDETFEKRINELIDFNENYLKHLNGTWKQQLARHKYKLKYGLPDL